MFISGYVLLNRAYLATNIFYYPLGEHSIIYYFLTPSSVIIGQFLFNRKLIPPLAEDRVASFEIHFLQIVW
jgi:hypothetical protein